MNSDLVAEFGADAVLLGEDLNATIGRLLKKISMICQAEELAILLPGKDGNLIFDPKLAFGIKEWSMPISANVGAVSGLQVQEINGVIRSEAATDFEAAHFASRNFICVRVSADIRDENWLVTGIVNVGVMYCFSKRYEQQYTDDDTRLLEMLAEQAGAVIHNHREFKRMIDRDVDLKRQLQEKDAEISRLQGIIDASGVNRPG